MEIWSFFLFLFHLFVVSNQQTRSDSLLVKAKNWASKFGAELQSAGDYVTRLEEANRSFSTMSVERRNDFMLVKEIADAIQHMMNLKISAVRVGIHIPVGPTVPKLELLKREHSDEVTMLILYLFCQRIMDTAENSALSFKDEDIEPNFRYYNAKCLVRSDEPPCNNETTKEAVLTENSHFWDLEVNTSLSAVHVPTNVYDRAQEVLQAIIWSENLNDIFKTNFQQDPSLSWQYFGSSTGFMRQYPAIQWKAKPVDLYDCRMRSWFIEAATSPKDLVILVDNSGSMTGMKTEIARHVVNNILDTLGNNDFVSILTFGENTTEIEPCFEEMLVQANLANIRVFKQRMENITTINIANFTLALNRAFRLLEKYRNESEPGVENAGARCNQAIMLVTDGVPYNFKEIFEEFNWPDFTVRVFTYLVGREGADVREIKWMACANRGYYVHLSTLAEVREQVLQYIPVMARPLVLNRTEHPTIWSPMYADKTDPKMSDWLWEQKQKYIQKKWYTEFRRDKKKFDSTEEIDKRRKEYAKMRDQRGNEDEYKMMTSVSMPVYDRRENATRIANLLGVAGTDVPIAEIEKLTNPFKLGVNAYAFLVTNNGYIISHPDLRPVFQNILKPNYNSVDMAEVELVNDNRLAREFEAIIPFREEVLKQEGHRNITLSTKYHYDNLKRVGLMRRTYHSYPIMNSPFTLVVAVPEGPARDPHRRQYRAEAKYETHRHVVDRLPEKVNFSEFFRGKWRIHPDWTYCKYHNDTLLHFNSPEAEFLHFLERSARPNFSWKSKTLVKPPESTHPYYMSNSASGKSDMDMYYYLKLVGWKRAYQDSKRKLSKEAKKCDAETVVMITANGAELTLMRDTKGRSLLVWQIPKGVACCNDSHKWAELDFMIGDKDLFQSLVYDASKTLWFNGSIRSNNSTKKEAFQKRFEITVAFIATRSGLTRWKSIDDKDDDTFGKLHGRAIDELWYKRAVEFNYEERKSFLYSVPIDVGTSNGTLVTASHAIFAENDSNRAPVAVVGYQFQHTALSTWFFHVTSACPTPSECNKTCADDNIACFVLDNNGYIIVSENTAETGIFFGEFFGNVMESMVNENIYERIKIFDYQAVCFENTDQESRGSILLAPWKIAVLVFKWLLTQMLSLTTLLGEEYSQIAAQVIPPISDSEEDMIEPTDRPEGPEETTDGILRNTPETNYILAKTRPQACDQEVDLYMLGPSSNRNYSRDSNVSRPYVVQPITGTNLVLVVVDKLWLMEKTTLSTTPTEVLYINNTLICHKAKFDLMRKRPKDCISRHEREKEIELCGLGSKLVGSWLIMVVASILTALSHSC